MKDRASLPWPNWRLITRPGSCSSREAQQLGQESLRIAESIGNRLAGQVKAWLEALPAEHQ